MKTKKYDEAMGDRAPVCPIEYEAGSWRNILMVCLRPVMNPEYPDYVRPIEPKEMEAFGYLPADEVYESMQWLFDRLTPEAKDQLAQAAKLAKKFPNLLVMKD